MFSGLSNVKTTSIQPVGTFWNDFSTVKTDSQITFLNCVFACETILIFALMRGLVDDPNSDKIFPGPNTLVMTRKVD